MTNVFVTGGAGFIGSALCYHLVQDKGCRVLNIDKLTYAGVRESLGELKGHPLYRFKQDDVCSRKKIAGLIEDFQPDTIMHLAAESHVDRSIDEPAVFVKTNILGTYTMLECARDYWNGLRSSQRSAFRFHQISTDEVYGTLGSTGFFSENTPYNPRSPYSASKASADHLARAWFHTYGFPVVITNCSNNYGPRQFPEKLIPLAILNALEGAPIPLYGKGGHIRDWLYVEDHARALAIAAESGRVGETYNVSGRNEHTNLGVVETICSTLDELRPRKSSSYKNLIAFMADRPGHDRRYAVDAAKLEIETGWKAREAFETGIRKTVRWYLENEWWWKPLRIRYAGERLGKGNGGT